MAEKGVSKKEGQLTRLKAEGKKAKFEEQSGSKKKKGNKKKNKSVFFSFVLRFINLDFFKYVFFFCRCWSMYDFYSNVINQGTHFKFNMSWSFFFLSFWLETKCCFFDVRIFFFTIIDYIIKCMFNLKGRLMSSC